MLLLGVLAAQAEGAVAGAGAYDLLETEILTGSQASVTFSSLNSTYGADYQHLQVRVTARTNRAFTGDLFEITLNSDTGSNYSYHGLYGNGSSVLSQGGGSAAVIEAYRISGGTNTSDSFGGGVIDILDAFETTKYTTLRTFMGTTGSINEVWLNSGLWQNTAAVDSINFEALGSLVAGSRFSLYGLKGA